MRRAGANHPVLDALQEALGGMRIGQGKKALADQPVVLGFSGGLDSTVLLHALWQLEVPVRAVHVNHQIQASADHWQQHCANFAATLKLPFEAVVVRVDSTHGSLEEAARLARYRALYAAMHKCEARLLMTAHHKDDQLETILLQLFRGSGLRGAAGMRQLGPIGVDRHLHPDLQLARPLLSVEKADLANYAAHFGLANVEDPSNSNPQYKRNWLRQKMLPELLAEFPQAGHGLLNLADHLSTHFAEVDAQAAHALVQLSDPHGRLKLAQWRALGAGMQRDVLRVWLVQHGVRAAQLQLLELERQLLECKAGGVRQVCSRWRVRIKQDVASLEIAPYE